MHGELSSGDKVGDVVGSGTGRGWCMHEAAVAAGMGSASACVPMHIFFRGS